MTATASWLKVSMSYPRSAAGDLPWPRQSIVTHR
jgi:hypothetical protein